MKKFILFALMGLMSVGAAAQRFTDKLDRGLVAVPTGNGNLVSWRKFGSEYYDTQYNLYRNGTKIAGPISVSNFQDAGGGASSKYAVEPVVRGVVQARSAEVQAWSQAYKDVKVQPVVNRNGKTIGNSVAGNSGGSDTTTPGYTLNDVTLADVTGDGICEFIVKRNNSQGNLLSSSNKTDFNLYECYTMSGERLWWIDLGPNLMAGPDEQWDLIAYDWDEDGKAECIMRGADNMIIHTSTGKTINVGNMNYYAPRDEYTHQGAEYLLYLNGETGEPFLGWDGGSSWTPMAFPLPRFEQNEAANPLNATSAEYAKVWGEADTGHRSLKIYMGAPYLDGRHASIFLGRGCYTRHKFCALDVNKTTHELTPRWRWNCYDAKSPWYGNGFHNFAIADVDMDGRDEIMFGSMCIDDTGFGLSTTGLGHGDAQHCTDLDPYRWGLEQFNCLEGSQGNSYWNPTTGELYFRKGDGGDDGRALAGNFSNTIPGSQGRSVSSGVIGLSCDKIIDISGDAMSGTYANLNNRIYWDGDLLDEMFNSKNGANRPAHIFKWGGQQIKEFSAISNNWTKCNPSAQGDILGDWREELVLRTTDNSALRIFCTEYATKYDIYTLWDDHVYRNGMCWQNVGYNQPPQTSFFLGELEGITVAPPPVILQGRTEVTNGGTITTTDDHLLVSGYADQTISVAEGASPWVLTVNAPAWVKGSGSQQADASTPKSPARTIVNYTTTLTGGAFSGTMCLVKQGEGTLVLPNVIEKHTGETNVWQGTLVFNGTMESSPVWMNRHTTLLSNGGRFNGGLKVDYNATVYPGGRDNVGSISASTLALGFGSRVVFDVSSPSSIDHVNATLLTIETKDWENGPKYRTPVFEFVGADQLTSGSYELGSVENVTGDVNDILIEGITVRERYYLEVKDKKLYLVLNAMREAKDNVVWSGSVSDEWDMGITENFIDGVTSTYSAQGDNVVFNDESTRTAVKVKGPVRPATISFQNAKANYTLTGDSILGWGTLTKSGTGNVTISNENRIKSTIINGGRLTVNSLANTTGVSNGALGNVSSTIAINDGATLATNWPIITDQPVTVSGNATIDVPTKMTLTFNKGFQGSGATVTKTGGGTMTTGRSGTYSKLVIKNGRVNSVVQNNIDQAPANIVLEGGEYWFASSVDNTYTNNANIEVPQGKTASIYSSWRGSHKGKLTGKGTLMVFSAGIRSYWDGDWSQFEGTIVPGTYDRSDKHGGASFNFLQANGLPKATLQLTGDVTVSNNDPNSNASVKYRDVEVGHVTTSGNGGTLAGSGRWIIGGLNKNMTVSFRSASPIVKRGTGDMTVWTPGLLTGTLTIEGGSVNIADEDRTTHFFGNVTISKDGTLSGYGLLPNLTVNEGGTVNVYDNLLYWPGTLQVVTSATIKNGATIGVIIDGKESNSLLQAKFLTLNGTVKVEFEDYKPKKGDEFTIWKGITSISGTPALDLPKLPAGLYWDTTALVADDGKAMKTGVLKVSDVAPTAIAAIESTMPVSCSVYTVGGIFVTSFTAPADDVRSVVSSLPLPPGTYVLQPQDRQVLKVVVK